MIINDIEQDLDLGSDHWLKYFSWSPDRELNPQYKDIPDNPRMGAAISHYKSDGSLCVSGIYFDCQQVRRAFQDKSMWIVESWEPLTISPSILCLTCNDHGFIRNGKWVKA